MDDEVSPSGKVYLELITYQMVSRIWVALESHRMASLRKCLELVPWRTATSTPWQQCCVQWKCGLEIGTSMKHNSINLNRWYLPSGSAVAWLKTRVGECSGLLHEYLIDPGPLRTIKKVLRLAGVQELDMVLTLVRSPMDLETFDNIAIKLFYNEKTIQMIQLYHQESNHKTSIYLRWLTKQLRL